MFRTYLMIGLWITAMLTSAYASVDYDGFLLVSTISMMMIVVAPMAAALSNQED